MASPGAVAVFLVACFAGARCVSIDCQETGGTLAATHCEYEQVCAVHCKSSCLTDSQARVFGTNYYSLESSICKSALHDLRISSWNSSAWTVLLRLKKQQRSDFAGSLRHGVTSENSLSSERYFVFLSPRIKDPPSIAIFPRDQTVITGRVVVFVCTAVGNPHPQIEWRKNGKRLSTSRYTVTKMTDGSVLRIDPVRSGRDNDTFECLAENGVGEPVRTRVVLTVLDESQVPPGFPHFELLPNLQGVDRNRSALLPCSAKGDPEPKLSWLRNDIPVDMSNPRYSLAAAGSLHIYDAQEEDQGNYECIAENSVGTAISPMATIFLRVRRVPPYFSIPPKTNYVVSAGATLSLTCVAVGLPEPYVRWRKGDVDLTPESDVPVGRNVLVLENVRESANYTCVAGSTLGSIENVCQVLVQAPGAPVNITSTEVTEDSLKIEWEPPLRRNGHRHHQQHNALLLEQQHSAAAFTQLARAVEQLCATQEKTQEMLGALTQAIVGLTSAIEKNK